MNLTLEKANINSLDLAVNIKNLDKTSTKCEIIMIPQLDTGYPTGTSKTVGTIEKCKNGKNIINIPNLKPNTNYLFQVMLEDGTVGKKYQNFKTLSTSETITNPKTSDANLYIILIFLLSSIISLKLVTKKMYS